MVFIHQFHGNPRLAEGLRRFWTGDPQGTHLKGDFPRVQGRDAPFAHQFLFQDRKARHLMEPAPQGFRSPHRSFGHGFSPLCQLGLGRIQGPH